MKGNTAKADVDDPHSPSFEIRSDYDVLLSARIMEGDVKMSEGFDCLVQSTSHILDSGNMAFEGERSPAEFFDDVGPAI